MLKACIHCGKLSDQKRCPEHRSSERNGSTRKWRKIRLEVLERDHYTCWYCGASPVDRVDHVIPVARGGDLYDKANLVAACQACNGSKGDKTAAEFGY